MSPRRTWNILELLPGDALSGVVLIVCAAFAMGLANSALGPGYFHLLEAPFVFGPIAMPVLHWINDLLMAVFFLVVGMEIKREIRGGELADARRAALPIAGALGGMIVPAAIYAAFNRAGPAAHGWGIPMATDIAFSLGVLALLGPRVPRGLTVFLAALAIADDLGAVLVIALFYTSELNLLALAAALGLAGTLALLARTGERRLWPFLIAAPALWWCMHASGVHSTIAGVLLGWTIPLHADRGGAPLTTLERALKPWVTWGVMPLFALANAGVVLKGGIDLTHPVALGVGLGLLVGKPLGILGMSYLLVRLGWAKLPRGASWGQLAGVGMIAGIGFTVALFVSSLSFPAGGELEPLAKMGVLTGSIAAAVLGTAFLARTLREPA